MHFLLVLIDGLLRQEEVVWVFRCPHFCPSTCHQTCSFFFLHILTIPLLSILTFMTKLWTLSTPGTNGRDVLLSLCFFTLFKGFWNTEQPEVIFIKGKVGISFLCSAFLRGHPFTYRTKFTILFVAFKDLSDVSPANWPSQEGGSLTSSHLNYV